RGLVVHEPQKKSIDPHMVARIERAQGELVAGRGRSDQRGIGGRCGAFGGPVRRDDEGGNARHGSLLTGLPSPFGSKDEGGFADPTDGQGFLRLPPCAVPRSRHAADALTAPRRATKNRRKGEGMTVEQGSGEYQRWEARFGGSDYAFGKEPN